MTNRNYGIQSARHSIPAPSEHGAVNSHDSRHASFITGKAFEAFYDAFALLFGIGFVLISAIGLAAAISVLIYYAVI